MDGRTAWICLLDDLSVGMPSSFDRLRMRDGRNSSDLILSLSKDELVERRGRALQGKLRGKALVFQ